jgi:hypothetical protein
MQNQETPTKRQFLIAVIFTAVLLLGVVLLKARSSVSTGWDFRAFYTSGLIVRTGHGRDLYDVERQAALQWELFHRGGFVLDLHPPFEALFFAPLTNLTYAQAYALWGAINVALWMLFAYLIRPYAPAPKNTLRYLLLCFLFLPAWFATLEGQTSLLLLFLWTLTFLCFQRGRDVWAGVFMGLGLFKFSVVLPFAFICLLRTKWRMMAGFVLAASVLGVASIITVGFAGVLAYMHLLLDLARHSPNPAYGAINPWNMPTIRGFCGSLLAGHVSSAWINAAVALVSGTFLLLTARQWRRADRCGSGAEQNLMFAAALAVSMLASAHLYSYDLVLLLLAILFVVGSPQWTERSRWRVILTVCLAILYCPPVYPLLVPRNMLYALAPVLATFALTTLLVASPAGERPATG